MTFNIRRRLVLGARRPADLWHVRRPRLRALLRAERPTLLAVQEAMPDQAAFVLKTLGASYGFVGRGREADGSGEGCPIFFDRERLELLGWQQTALSDTPEVAGSRSWGNPLPRIAVTATVRDRSTSAVFRLVNTHLDPYSAPSRLHCAVAIRDLAASGPGNSIVTGDLNDGPGSPAVRELLAGSVLADAWVGAQERTTPEYATFAGYRRPRAGRRIDWILTTPGIQVRRIGINPGSFGGGRPSDHLPVEANVLVPAGAPRDR